MNCDLKYIKNLGINKPFAVVKDVESADYSCYIPPSVYFILTDDENELLKTVINYKKALPKNYGMFKKEKEDKDEPLMLIFTNRSEHICFLEFYNISEKGVIADYVNNTEDVWGKNRV